MILSTCRSFIPREYLKMRNVFPERDRAHGLIYVEAADKVTLNKIREVSFVKVNDVLGVIYESKSGSTKLKWRRITGIKGKVTGIASINAIVNLSIAGIITANDAKKLVKSREIESLKLLQ
ncbi:MAG: hypothetical protein QW511_05655 [Candidatus Methanomethylicia archaeon]